MLKYIARNKDSIILGVIGNAVTAALAIAISWLNVLPPIQVPAWVILVLLGIPVSIWAVRRKKKLVPIVEEKFGVERVSIDGKRFIQCKFDGSELVFSGDAGFGLERNDMTGIRVTFAGPAAATVSALIAMHRDEAFRPFVKGLIQQIQGENRPRA